MNYHELERMATPGPLRVLGRWQEPGCAQEGLIHHVTIGTEHGDAVARAVSAPYPAGNPRNDHRNKRTRNNAALLVHCVNHFGKALDALEELFCNICDADRDGDQATIDELSKLIAELEEVEGV